MTPDRRARASTAAPNVSQLHFCSSETMLRRIGGSPQSPGDRALAGVRQSGRLGPLLLRPMPGKGFLTSAVTFFCSALVPFWATRASALGPHHQPGHHRAAATPVDGRLAPLEPRAIDPTDQPKPAIEA